MFSRALMVGWGDNGEHSSPRGIEMVGRMATGIGQRGLVGSAGKLEMNPTRRWGRLAEGSGVVV